MRADRSGGDERSLPHVYKSSGGWWIATHPDYPSVGAWGPFATFRELWMWVNPRRKAGVDR